MTASAVDRVCRGGGVVASLVYDVEYDVSVEYGGSVEYDGSVEYGGCGDAVVVGAPKEQKIKKNAN